MTNSKLENIENGIIKLLWQKYMIDTYKEVNIYKQSKINKNRLKENVINNDNQVSENIDNLLDSILTKYVEIDNNLCLYDVDIINLILKYISTIKSLTLPPKKYSIIESIYYYMGYPIEEPYILDYNSVIKKSVNMNSKIKSFYLQIIKKIIIPNT
jgi:hypothetical protein